MNKNKLTIKIEDSVENFGNVGTNMGTHLNKILSNCKWCLISFTISIIFGVFGFVVNFFKSLFNIKRIS